jgi:aminopeptidase N
MDLYFARHDGQAVTVEDFLGCFADATGRNLDQFRLWYAQAGTPEIAASGSYDAEARTYTLTLTQAVPPTPGQPTKAAMVVPIALGLIGPDGQDLGLDAPGAPLADGVLALSTPSLTVTFRNVPAPPTPSLLRGFSAPVKLNGLSAGEDLLFRMRHDADAFNRWQAGQTYALRLLTRPERGADEEHEAFADALGALARDERLEPAFVAQALLLPSEADVAQEIGKDVDPDAIHDVREALKRAIGRRIGAVLGDLYGRHASNAPYSPDALSAGRRALRAAALDLLAATREAEPLALVEAHYANADNMTDRIAALAVLTRLDDAPRAPREAALADFYARFEGDALVIDKWFALQAAAPGRDTLDRVQALTDHPAFSFANPNRVRSLVGSFAAANHTEFNRPDGAGYDFVADVVLGLDKRNPQVAVRLLSAFKSWRVLEAGRRTRAEAALGRVAAEPSLSPDVADIVNRCLQ